MFKINMNFLIEYIDFYLNDCFYGYLFNGYELIDVVDLQKLASFGEVEPKIGLSQVCII